MVNQTNFKNHFKLEQWRNGKLIDSWECENGIVNEGANHLLNVIFGSTAKVSYYIGPLDGATASVLDDTDTMASHAGWIEATAYTNSTRPQWTPIGTATGRQINNTTPVSFVLTADTDIDGVFMTTNSTKSGTTGTLYSTALFDTVKNLLNGDELRVTYYWSVDAT